MNVQTDLNNRLDKLFFPQSVAIVGASDVPGKWGNLILTSILAGGYQGRIYPVNPKKDTLLQLTSYPSLLDIPGTVDLAIFVIPAERVPDGIRECASKGIPAAVIISSGFRETGGQGAELEKQIVEIANSAGIALMGPNTMGLASAHHRFEAIPTPTSAGPGGLAIISQSGNLGLQILKWTAHKGIGLSIYAGTGNEAQLNAGDLLSYLGTRDEVKAVAMYIEGITEGTTFAHIARGVSAKKPVIAIKTGRSKSGSMAAQSHTGSLAGSYATYQAAFKQAGIIQVKTPTELLNVSTAMTHLPVPRSNRVGIMTMGGGWGIIAADECEDRGLVLPELDGTIVSELDKILPAYWNRRNPVDVVGEGNPDLYIHVIETLAKWDQTDCVIALGIVGRSSYVEDFIAGQERIDGQLYSRELKLAVLKDQIRSEQKVITGMARIQKETGKPVLVVSLTEAGLSLADTDHGRVCILSSPEDAVIIAAHMSAYGRFLSQI